jgi:NifB/MoaA-like Fe-S oxidoreductase
MARQKRVFPKQAGDALRRVTVVTGALFRPILEDALRARLQRTGEETEVNLVGVRNDFFGPAVTVAGLLSGGDILRALADQDLGERILLPPAVLNDDELFLDDLTRVEMEKRLGVPVQAGFRDRWW